MTDSPPSTGSRGGIERTAYWLLTAGLGMTLFNLLTAQVLFGLAALLWLWVIRADGRRPEVPAFFWPLAGYAALTLASAPCLRIPKRA